MMTETQRNLAALRAAIIAAPAEDAVRIAYADAAADSPDPADQAHAEFIELGFRLHRIGPPRFVFEMAGPLPAAGPDYWRYDADAESPVREGDRVDVRSLKRHYHGLLVTRRVDVDGEAVLSLKRDAGSVPYPHAEVRGIMQRQSALAADHWFHFFGGVPGERPGELLQFNRAREGDRHFVPATDGMRVLFLASASSGIAPLPVTGHYRILSCRDHQVTLTPDRGFLGYAECTIRVWHEFGDRIVAAYPITRVRFTAPSLNSFEVANLRKTYARRWPSVPPEGWVFPV